ncbi:MAG TPA: S49 family peptidase [Acidisarcina sp.]|nr:S49 family peptidase [Acidisarcina sp.]
MKTYTRILAALSAMPWAILPEKLQEIAAFLEMKATGGGPGEAQLATLRAEQQVRAARVQNASASAKGAVAVIPIYGTIVQRATLMSEYSGGCSTEQLTAQFRQARNDPNVRAIVFDVDSPGGTISGVPELADEIYAARKTKKVIAVSNSLMASAAYWIACSCSEVVVSPSSLTGSIGVYILHEDISKRLDEEGIRMTFVKHGENKTEGNSYQPLTPAALEHLQEMVDSPGAMFDKAVARGRGVSLAEVTGKFGQGRVFPAQQAVTLGLADRVATLDDVLGQYGVTRNSGAAARAALGVEAPLASADGGPEGDAEDGDCTCPCEPCQSNDDCDDCDHVNCNCEGCDCPSAIGIQQAAQRRKALLAGL